MLLLLMLWHYMYTEGIIYWWSISLMCYAALSAMRLNNEWAVSVFTTNFGKCRPISATFFVSCLRIICKGCWDWTSNCCISNIPWHSLRWGVPFKHLHPEIRDRFLKLIFRSGLTLCQIWVQHSNTSDRQAGCGAKSQGLYVRSYAMPFSAHMT